MEYQIVKKPKFRVVGMEINTTMIDGKHAKDCPMVWEKFMPREKEIKNLNPGICYGLCIMKNENEFRYIAAVESDGEIPKGMIELEIPESEYIKTTHKGHISKVGQTWNLLMLELLPTSGKIGDMNGISFEYYDARYKNDETNETDIYLPVK
ncbi:AraC family transcriptional regulator [archaeon]|jgi:AraC family transcriptional regulator|nr:AraC family transcriptional regulator [archaeon]MBT4022922.1 AraC family transcriptional regulator [archaeon]MBT4271913.1 AraC family transcriptional regulator [archaeon]MBT4461751.1 AraC family transcriptional regulator [archaeon]MBT4858721.1 AraC family transcriptional regulator [archaeon]